ncbi:MAG: hypothetical protein IT349_11495 [Candidatus Eisenbacteria bacterium]|nr:hypothetical protein [Candidatus Eisenbacteria bacterium]
MTSAGLLTLGALWLLAASACPRAQAADRSGTRLLAGSAPIRLSRDWGVRWVNLERPAFRPEGDGLRLRASFGSTFDQWGKWALPGGLELDSGFRFQAEDGGPWTLRLPEVALRVPIGKRTIATVGKARRRWGTGELGNLLLGRSAAPRWQIAVSRDRLRSNDRAIPSASPGQVAGWDCDLFLSYLDDDRRTIPDPLLAGHSLSLAPWSWIELTVARTILFGGEGRTGRLTGRDLWNIALARNENIRGPRGPGDSDQKVSYRAACALSRDRAARLGLDQARAFYEYAGEDALKNLIPTARARHFGLALERAGHHLAAEYASTHTGANRWYTHTIYRDAYFYRGLPLGLPMGGDARAYYLHLRPAPYLLPPGRHTLQLDLGLEQHLFGLETGTRDRRNEATLRLEVGSRRPESGGSGRTACSLTLAGARRVSGRREPTAPGMIDAGIELALHYCR